jgi:glycosyltransferase involved in cell wall biosynthesis
MKKISVVTHTFHEEENVELLYKKVKAIFDENLSHYSYEHIFIDNASKDKTVTILKEIAKVDKNVKIIVNSRNFGHMRSPIYGFFQASGDAVITLAADFQEPPEMILDFVKKWEEGFETVIAVKKDSQEKKIMFKIREFYYSLLSKLSEVKIVKNYTGFGLYDRKVVNALMKMDDAYPFFRGMVAEAGFNICEIEFNQPMRIRGLSKNNFYTLYDTAMLGIISNSKVPLRLAIFIGTITAIVSFFVGLFYFIAKIIYWDSMSIGIAPLVIGGSFAFSILLIFLGILGEYIGAIYTQVLNRPLVFEKERINFD